MRIFRRESVSLPQLRLLCHTVVLAALALAPTALSATYYIDFDNGFDTNPGTSTASAWKHAPGDSNALGVPKQLGNLSPGDTAIFKGGVVYRGSILIPKGGTATGRITFAGDQWGTSKAILDGSDLIRTAWTKCADSTDCRGNTNWNNIYYTQVPPGVLSGFATLIYDSTNWCAFAQEPNPLEPIAFDDLNGWRPVEPVNITPSSLTDPTLFNQADPNYWRETWLCLWVNPNDTVIRPIEAFDTAANRVSWTLQTTPYQDRTSYYSLINHPTLIDKPGEYAVSTNENRLYLWPPDSNHPTNHTWSMSVRKDAFPCYNVPNVTVKGFVARAYCKQPGFNGYGGAFLNNGGGAANVQVLDNDISLMRSCEGNAWAIIATFGDNILIKNNTIRESLHIGGVFVGNGTNLQVLKNDMRRIGFTGIYAAAATNSLVASNSLVDVLGNHVNGISVYSSSLMVTVRDNFLKNISSPITFERSRDLLFYKNVVDGAGRDQRVSEWGGCFGTVAWINNTVVNCSSHNSLQIGVSGLDGNDISYVVRNNIIDGGGPSTNVVAIRDHNLWVGLSYANASRYGWTLNNGETYEPNLGKIFVSPGVNWNLLPGTAPASGGKDLSDFTNPMLANIQGEPFIGALDPGGLFPAVNLRPKPTQ